ncbi:DNA-methyltransferase [Microbacterium sp. F51-2R]|uniref:DNA-methyltransferase n=1 Tax=Microbacterium sp. F51-2R TaxID=3445777 RepID=UPI003FA1223C
MSLYYQDDSVTLYQGRCEDILPTLSLTGSVHLITDPPYFQVKDAEWDNQWSRAAEFLDWMGEWLTLAKPLLSADASVWVFASPELTSAVESVVARDFRVLNSVRWVKEQGWHKKAELDAMRSFLSPWEGIVFAERLDDAYGEAALALHRKVFAPLGRYLQTEWERAGWKAGAVGKALGYDSALPVRWAEGSSLPTADAYRRLRDLLNAGDSAEYLRREYEDLRREYEDLRRPFSIRTRDRSTDVWFFDNVAPYPGKHPCEKPFGLLTHIIETTTRPGDTVLDCFAGSGAILDVARQLGRKAVGIEMDAHWCKQAAKRLGQQTFDFSEFRGIR